MDLDTLLTDYYPSDETVEVLRNMQMVLLVGITGAGKDTLRKRLMTTSKYERIVTSTTRAPRLNKGILEQHGVDYYFFTLDEAAEKIKRREYFEVAKVHEMIYGVTIDELLRLHQSGKIAIGDVDYQGAAHFKKYAPNVTTIFIVPPSYDVWIERAKQRYASEAEFLEAWPARRKSAINELQHVLEVPYYHVVVNDDLDKAAEAIEHVIETADIYTRKDDEARLRARDLLDAIEAHP